MYHWIIYFSITNHSIIPITILWCSCLQKFNGSRMFLKKTRARKKRHLWACTHTGSMRRTHTISLTVSSYDSWPPASAAALLFALRCFDGDFRHGARCVGWERARNRSKNFFVFIIVLFSPSHRNVRRFYGISNVLFVIIAPVVHNTPSRVP